MYTFILISIFLAVAASIYLYHAGPFEINFKKSKSSLNFEEDTDRRLARIDGNLEKINYKIEEIKRRKDEALEIMEERLKKAEKLGFDDVRIQTEAENQKLMKKMDGLLEGAIEARDKVQEYSRIGHELKNSPIL